MSGSRGGEAVDDQHQEKTEQGLKLVTAAEDGDEASGGAAVFQTDSHEKGGEPQQSHISTGSRHETCRGSECQVMIDTEGKFQ